MAARRCQIKKKPTTAQYSRSVRPRCSLKQSDNPTQKFAPFRRGWRRKQAELPPSGAEAPPAEDYKANVGAGAGQRGCFCRVPNATGAAHQKTRQTCATFFFFFSFKPSITLFFLFLFLFCFDYFSNSTPAAADMTTAVASPFFDFDIMNKVSFASLCPVPPLSLSLSLVVSVSMLAAVEE